MRVQYRGEPCERCNVFGTRWISVILCFELQGSRANEMEIAITRRVIHATTQRVIHAAHSGKSGVRRGSDCQGALPSSSRRCTSEVYIESTYSWHKRTATALPALPWRLAHWFKAR